MAVGIAAVKRKRIVSEGRGRPVSYVGVLESADQLILLKGSFRPVEPEEQTVVYASTARRRCSPHIFLYLYMRL